MCKYLVVLSSFSFKLSVFSYRLSESGYIPLDAGLQSYDAVSAVDVDSFAGHAGGKIA